MSTAEETAGPIGVVLLEAAPSELVSKKAAAWHRAAGRSLAAWVVRAAREAGCNRVLVVSPSSEVTPEDRECLAREADAVEWALAADGDAALSVAAALLEGSESCLVLRADTPLLEAEPLRGLLDRHRREPHREPGEPVCLFGPGPGEAAIVVEASQLGRVSELAQKALPEGTQSAQPVESLLRVTDRARLARAEERLRTRIIDDLLRRGVTVVDARRLVVEAGVSVGADVILHPDVALLEGSVVGDRCELHQGAWVRDSRLAAGVNVFPYSVLDGAEVAEGCNVGPFARLRPGTRLGRGSRIGNFVEVKASTLGEGSKANHLAYIGDAEVGERVNIGAGAVTCNYDGARKHRTVIGDDAFVGSDTMLIAPVRVGKGSLTAAGSVIHQDVPDEALAVGRARQRNVEGWAKRKGPQAKRQKP